MPRPRPQASAAAAKPQTLPVLKRLYHDGSITHAQYVGYRDEYKRDKAFARSLSGARRLDMSGVLAVVDRMAARGVLTASRLPPVFLILERNRQWWNTGPLLASGQRVSFKGSELIYQYVPGEGIQLHPLANFGVLNALSHTKLAEDRMEHMMNELLPLAAKRAGGIAWEYYFDFGGGAPPWVSGLAQGTALQAFAHAATKAGTGAAVFPVVARGLKIFETGPPSGVLVHVGAGNHYLQYSFAPGLRIINGFIQSLVGLFDFAKYAQDTTAEKLFERGAARAKQELPTYDTGAWSLYDRGSDSHESNLNYHQVLVGFLTSLCNRTQDDAFCGAAGRFKSYLHEVPGVDVLTHTLRAGKHSAIRFRLSKISRVSVQLRRSGKVVYDYTATMAYGTRSLPVTPPKKAKSYDVRIVATDLAGNTGTYTATIAVRRT